MYCGSGNASGQLADAAAYAPGGCCVCTQQMEAPWKIKNRTPSIKNNPAKFHLDPIWNERGLGQAYCEEVVPKRRKEKQPDSEMTIVSDLTALLSSHETRCVVNASINK